jgi:hypothetical protein
MKYIYIALSALALQACGATAPERIIDIQEVKVPVPYCPAPKVIPYPHLDVLGLAPEANQEQIVKSVAASFTQLMEYAKQLEIELEAVRRYSAEVP